MNSTQLTFSVIGGLIVSVCLVALVVDKRQESRPDHVYEITCPGIGQFKETSPYYFRGTKTGLIFIETKGGLIDYPASCMIKKVP